METEKEVLVLQFAIFGLVFFAYLLLFSEADWQWLSRYGAYLTILGIYLTFFEIEDWKNESLVFTHRKMENPEEYVLEFAEEQKNNPKVKKKISIQAKTYLMLGTILWGFGDIPNFFK